MLPELHLRRVTSARGPRRSRFIDHVVLSYAFSPFNSLLAGSISLNTMSHSAESGHHGAFRAISDTRSRTRPTRAFRTNLAIPFAKFEACQVRLRKLYSTLQSKAEIAAKSPNARTPAHQAADSDTCYMLYEVLESILEVLTCLRTTFPNNRTWSNADKADMPSSPIPVKEGFIQTFQVSLLDSLTELLEKVQKFVQAPSPEYADEAVSPPCAVFLICTLTATSL